MMNKVNAKISKLEHRGRKHIKVDFPNTLTARQRIKSVAGYKYSRTHRCWYIPNTFEALEALKQHFEVASLEPLNSPETTVSKTQNKSSNQPKKRANFQVFSGTKIKLEKDAEKWIRAFVPYDKKGWIEVIRDIPGRKWNSDGKFWVLPYVKDTFQRFIGVQYFELDFEVATTIPKDYHLPKKKKTAKQPRYRLNDYQQRAITTFEEKLLKEHKAWRTIKTYKALFTHFLAYFPNTKPSQISKEQIEKYIVYKKQENASDSQMNQLINALNCFFIRLLEQDDKVARLERPKKKRKLPNVFSLEEIERLLKSCENLKHKSMLMLVYSGGLRRSEVLNLRVEDLNFDRKTIYVKNAKGGKDRFTFFADSARKYLSEYIKQYQPTYYLFEGQTRGRYSESSIQKIFDAAKRKSKVTRSVTIHGLRHSFATHLVEKGVPLHVVQELLGHYSIKTTEIYLHISNKFRKELKSPLDDLEI